MLNIIYKLFVNHDLKGDLHCRQVRGTKLDKRSFSASLFLK